MKKQILLTVAVLISFKSLYSQDNNAVALENLKKGNEIIIKARKAIGIQTEGIKTFRFKSKSMMANKIMTSSGSSFGEPVTEISAIIPNNIQFIWSIEEPFHSVSTSTWDGPRYKKTMETDMLGTRRVVDVTEASFKNRQFLEKLNLDKEKRENLKKAGDRDPRENFRNKIWVEFFPLSLINPFEQNLEFKYMGRAESSNRLANVVEVKSTNRRNYRLLFDSETDLLLMMIESFTEDDGSYEIKYYFSNRELVENILIPKKIKVESKFTSKGKESRIAYQNIDMLEFSLKPVLKKDMFEIK